MGVKPCVSPRASPQHPQPHPLLLQARSLFDPRLKPSEAAVVCVLAGAPSLKVLVGGGRPILLSSVASACGPCTSGHLVGRSGVEVPAGFSQLSLSSCSPRGLGSGGGHR